MENWNTDCATADRADVDQSVTIVGRLVYFLPYKIAQEELVNRPAFANYIRGNDSAYYLDCSRVIATVLSFCYILEQLFALGLHLIISVAVPVRPFRAYIRKSFSGSGLPIVYTVMFLNYAMGLSVLQYA